MNTGDWIFYYATQAIEWLNPVVYLVGLVVAVWAFRRCRKLGYLVVAVYFALSAFTLLAMPSINRAIRAHRPPDYSAQTQQKIDAAVQDAIHKVLAEEGRPYGVPAKRTVRFPFGPIVLVAGLWLLAKREPQNPAKLVTDDTNTPNDKQPSA
jgi:hypothetical protein